MFNRAQFYHVYVLRSLRDGKFYIGQSTDVYRRLQQHLDGLNRSTWRRRPLELIFFESFLNKEDADRRERYLKTAKGKTTLCQMIRCYLDPVGGRNGQ